MAAEARKAGWNGVVWRYSGRQLTAIGIVQADALHTTAWAAAWGRWRLKERTSRGVAAVRDKLKCRRRSGGDRGINYQ